MEHIDTRFEQLANKDFEVEQTLDETHLDAKVASITTREAIFAPKIQHTMLEGFIPDEYRIDASPFVNRPFYLGTTLWNNNAPQFTCLDLPVHQLPRDVFTSNLSLENALKMASLFRSELILNISLSGTLVHSGTLLIGVLPPMLEPINSTNYTGGNEQQYWINSILSGPHAFLHANEATSVNLEVPWYCNTDYGELDTASNEAPTSYVPNATLNFKTANYASLVAIVLQPLLNGGGAGDITLIMEATFKNLELYLPAPRFLRDSDWTVQAGGLIDGKKAMTTGAAALGTSLGGPVGGMIGGAAGGLAAKATTGLLDMGTKGLKKMVPFLGDALDFGRGLISSWTGLHNPNNPSIANRFITTSRNFPNVTDVEQFFEKLDPYATENRLVKEPIFGSLIDEMSLSHITSKRQYIGQFKITTDDSVGKLLFCRPISPFQGGVNYPSAPSRYGCNNIELLHSLSRAWRGDIKIILQSSMNNKQFTKLKVIKYYNPSNKVTVATPAMRALANAPSQLLEFNGGGQELAITLPYMCRNDLMPCHNDFVSEGLLHGLYYIYLAQNLIVADNSPMEVNFNVYIQCEPNFRFYGYSTRPVEFIKNIPSQPEQGIIPDPTQRKTETWAAESGDFANGVMNAPQEQDDTISSNPVDAIADHYSRLRPLVDIRPFIRRMYLALEKTTTLGEGTTPFFFPLSKFINEMPFVTSWGTDIRRRTIPLVSSMYYGHSVGFKLHMQFFPRRVEQNFTDIKNSIEPRIFYVPPGLKIEAPNSVLYPSTIYSQFPNIELYLNNNGMFSIPEITSQNQPTVDSNGAVNFEFVIPNITWFKFMGGIYKYLTERQIISTRTNVNTLANTDYGFLVVVFKVNTLQETTPGLMRIYVGLTDESRFGFHTIAPVFAISNEKQDIYMNDLNTHTEHYLPKSMYFGSGAL